MKIAIIGNGGWGTANALLLKRNGHDVILWGAFGDYFEEMEKLGTLKMLAARWTIPIF